MSPCFGPKPLSLQAVEKDLAKAFDKDVLPDAVAITVNSPGGSPAGAHTRPLFSST